MQRVLNEGCTLMQSWPGPKWFMRNVAHARAFLMPKSLPAAVRSLLLLTLQCEAFAQYNKEADEIRETIDWLLPTIQKAHAHKLEGHSNAFRAPTKPISICIVGNWCPNSGYDLDRNPRQLTLAGNHATGDLMMNLCQDSDVGFVEMQPARRKGLAEYDIPPKADYEPFRPALEKLISTLAFLADVFEEKLVFMDVCPNSHNEHHRILSSSYSQISVVHTPAEAWSQETIIQYSEYVFSACPRVHSLPKQA